MQVGVVGAIAALARSICATRRSVDARACRDDDDALDSPSIDARPIARRIGAHLDVPREAVLGLAPRRVWTAEARSPWGRARQRASYL